MNLVNQVGALPVSASGLAGRRLPAHERWFYMYGAGHAQGRARQAYLAYLHPMTSLPFRPSFPRARARARNRLARRTAPGRSPASTRACRRTGCRSGCRTGARDWPRPRRCRGRPRAAGLVDMAVLERRPARGGNRLVPAPPGAGIESGSSGPAELFCELKASARIPARSARPASAICRCASATFTNLTPAPGVRRTTRERARRTPPGGCPPGSRTDGG